MNRLFTSILAVVFCLGACSNRQSSTELSPGSASDTAMSFRVYSKSITIRSGKPFVDLVAFQAFLDSLPTITFPMQHAEVSDVRGSGILDSCVASISLVGGLPFVEHSIMSNGKRIWYDTLTIQTIQVSTSLWGDDSSYVRLMPYSGLFLAKTKFGNFLGATVDTGSPEFSSFLFNDQKGARTDHWRTMYQSFTGHWIWYLDVSDPGGMIWDPEKRIFIHYWGS